jgi:rhodanese-related sulfurtransferase
LPTHDPALRKDRPVILYRGSGGRAALAGKTLVEMGFKDVRNVGGFKGLVEAGWSVEPG